MAWLFARRLASPIAPFARAAERLGRDPAHRRSAFAARPRSVAAAAAFNHDAGAPRPLVSNRTTMVGAIAHDLRTPLTRLRFRIEAAPDELKAKMAGDIDEMEAMVAWHPRLRAGRDPAGRAHPAGAVVTGRER